MARTGSTASCAASLPTTRIACTRWRKWCNASCGSGPETNELVSGEQALIFALPTSASFEVWERSLSLFVVAVATLGFVAFVVVSLFPSTSHTRRFALLNACLAAWSFTVLLQWALPNGIAPAFRWLTAAALPVAALRFVALQAPDSWCARPAAERAVWVGAGLTVASILGLERSTWSWIAMVFVYGGLLAATAALLRASRDRGRLRLLAGGSALVCLCAVHDQLRAAGIPFALPIPSPTPLALLFFVALLGTSVAHERFEQLRADGGRLVTFAVLAGVVAAGLAATLAQMREPTTTLLWIWFVLLAFGLLQRPLWAFLDSPFQRARSRARESLLEHWRSVDLFLAGLDESAALPDQLERWLCENQEVSAARVDDSLAVETIQEREVSSLFAPLSAGGVVLGRVEVRLRRGDLDRDSLLRREFETLARRVGTALSALRLQEGRRQREHLERLGVMATGIAHEIKGPLGAIVGAVDLLADDVRDARAQRWLGVLRQESVRLSEFVSEVLTYGRLPKPRWECFPLRDLAEALELSCRDRVVLSGTHLQLEFPDRSWCGDEAQIRHLLFNLVANALEALQEAGLRDRCIVVRAVPGEFGLRVLVVDDGVGVSLEAQPQLFEPFFTTRAKGTGLGLAIAQQVALAHGGTLRCVDRAASAAFGLEDDFTRSLGGARFLLALPEHEAAAESP